jgi:hypothetical protein
MSYPKAPLTRRQAVHHKPRRPSHITVPERVSPHVKLVFTEMQRQCRTYDEVEEGSGVLRTTLKAWRHKNKPGLDSIEAVLGFLGWDFLPVPRAKVLPAALVEDVAAVAAKHPTSFDKTVEVLVGLVARIYDRFPFVEAPRRWSAPEPDKMQSMLTRAQAASVLGKTADTLNRWKREGRGPTLRMPVRRHPRCHKTT